jgi:hypothetical protein
MGANFDMIIKTPYTEEVTQRKQVYDLRFDVINSLEAEMLRLLLFTVQQNVGGVLCDEGLPFPKVTFALI